MLNFKLFNDGLFSFIQSLKESDLGNSWIKSSIADIIKAREDITINDISNHLGVSGNTVNRIFSEWEKEALKNRFMQ